MDSYENLKRYNHLHGEIEAVYHEVSLRLGISDSVTAVLYTICNSGDSFLLNDICRYTGLNRQTINSAIRRLEKDDIVYLEAVNGKAKKVCLTENGKHFVKKTVLRFIEIENVIFGSWSDDDIQKHLELTERYLLALRKGLEQL